jgi:triacylglycerol lipase
MVGWHLLLLLVIECVAYGSIARQVHQVCGWSVGAAAGLAAAVYVGVRVVLVGLEFVLARWKGDAIPAPLRVGSGALLRMYLRELGGWLLMFTLVLPFVPARRSVIDRWRKEPAPSLPILLIHGLACNRGNWFVFRRRLERNGHAAFTVDCTPPFAGIGTYAPQVARAVDEIVAATGASRVILIGHSMGGLVARAYLDQFGADKVAHVITMGSPHRGTWMTRFALGPNVRDMDLGNSWLAGLRKREAARSPSPYAGFTCIVTLHDNLVTPQSSATLPGAAVVTLSGIGHLSLALSREVMDVVLDKLREIGAGIRRPD